MSLFTTMGNVNLTLDTFVVIWTNWYFFTHYIQYWKYYGKYTTEAETSTALENAGHYMAKNSSRRILSLFTTMGNVNLTPDTSVVIRTNWSFFTHYIGSIMASILLKLRPPQHYNAGHFGQKQ